MGSRPENLPKIDLQAYPNLIIGRKYQLGRNLSTFSLFLF